MNFFSKLIGDDTGAPSTMRVLCFLVIGPIVFVWTYLSIQHGAFEPIPPTVLGLIGSMLTGKVAQSFSENKTPIALKVALVAFLLTCAFAPHTALAQVGPPMPSLAAPVGPDTNDYSLDLPVTWLPSTNGPVLNYALWWGPAARKYTNHLDVGTATSVVFEIPDYRSAYHFAITAQIGKATSAPSAELVWPLPATNIVKFTLTVQRTPSLALPFQDFLRWTIALHTNPTANLFYRTRMDVTSSNVATIFQLDASTLVISNQTTRTN